CVVEIALSLPVLSKEPQSSTDADFKASSGLIRDWVHHFMVGGMQEGVDQRIIPEADPQLPEIRDYDDFEGRGIPLYEGEGLLESIPVNYPERQGSAQFLPIPGNEGPIGEL